MLSCCRFRDCDRGNSRSVPLPDLTKFQPLVDDWARYGFALAADIENARNSAGAMAWRSPAGQAAASSVALALAAARRCEGRCHDVAAALLRHRAAVQRALTLIDLAEHLSPLHLLADAARRIA